MTGEPFDHPDEELLRRIDTSKPHPARVYDVLLGGKDNYPVDRTAVSAALAHNPRAFLTVRHNRDVLRRTVTMLTKEKGVRQFLDVGAGLPTGENVHQVAQGIAPESRIVYVDNDPIVLVHARSLLTSRPEGRTDYVDADIHDPARILGEAARTLDFDKPVALLLVAVLHFVEDEAYDIVKELVDGLPSGSWVVLTHLTGDFDPNSEEIVKTFKDQGLTFVHRTKDEVERFFTDNGLELVEPGVIQAHEWRPDHAAPVLPMPDLELFEAMEPIDRIKYYDINKDVEPADVSLYAGVARKS